MIYVLAFIISWLLLSYGSTFSNTFFNSWISVLEIVVICSLPSSVKY